MVIKKLRKDDNVNAAIEVMMASMDMQDEPEIGCFWFDLKAIELFGVESVPASSMQYYESPQFHARVRTGPKLHSSIWKREYMRQKDIRFRGDYTKVPRGRVFEFEPDKFVVFTGSWINRYPIAKQLIEQEFNLPDDTEFRIDEHWDIGYGWSEEF